VTLVPIYVFRAPYFAPAGDTIASAAPLDAVVAVYGGGGIKNTGGLSKEFGGAAVFRSGMPGFGKYYLGVWGERKASKFRETLRQGGIDVEIIKTPPPAKLIWWETK
jgi:hypothetical protein